MKLNLKGFSVKQVEMGKLSISNNICKKKEKIIVKQNKEDIFL